MLGYRSQTQKITRFDVYETLCPQQLLVHKGGQIKKWVGFAEMSHLQKFEADSCYSFHDIMITNFQSPNLEREII